MRRFPPRGPSRRAASAARILVCGLLLSGCRGEAAAPLPALRIDGGRIAVAGLSSGAYMATQAHLAYSGHLRGAALFSGGPWGCAGGDVQVALGTCMRAPPPGPDIAALVAEAAARAADGRLAPRAGLAGDRVYVLHGRRDPLVAPALGKAAADFYRRLDAGVEVELDDQRDFGHLLPAPGGSADCLQGGTPWLGDCGLDAAGAALAWIYGPPPAPAAADAAGELRVFDQAAVAAEGEPQLAATGLLYVPPACADGANCGLLVIFHGCQQGQEKVGDAFAHGAGFNRWADVYSLVVLYPQVQASYMPLNPKGCWDWWGYTGPDYDSRTGAQLRWLAAASAALGAPLE